MSSNRWWESSNIFCAKQLPKIFRVPLSLIANDDDDDNNNNYNIRSNCRQQDVALMIIYNTSHIFGSPNWFYNQGFNAASHFVISVSRKKSPLSSQPGRQAKLQSRDSPNVCKKKKREPPMQTPLAQPKQLASLSVRWRSCCATTAAAAAIVRSSSSSSSSGRGSDSSSASSRVVLTVGV